MQRVSSQQRYLQQLISEGEHQQQDFKYKVTDAIKLARSVSAFANTDGGRLLIGVRDDGHISGVRSEEEIHVMHQAAFKYCRPEASIKFDTYHVNGRTIVMATIPPSEHRPVYAIDENGQQRAYIRIADENIVATPVHLTMWRESQRLQGIMMTFNENVSQLVHAMEGGQTINQLVRRSHLPRHLVISILAHLMRFGTIRCKHDNQRFLFSLI